MQHILASHWNPRPNPQEPLSFSVLCHCFGSARSTTQRCLGLEWSGFSYSCTFWTITSLLIWYREVLLIWPPLSSKPASSLTVVTLFLHQLEEAFPATGLSLLVCALPTYVIWPRSHRFHWIPRFLPGRCFWPGLFCHSCWANEQG